MRLKWALLEICGVILVDHVCNTEMKDRYSVSSMVWHFFVLNVWKQYRIKKNTWKYKFLYVTNTNCCNFHNLILVNQEILKVHDQNIIGKKCKSTLVYTFIIFPNYFHWYVFLVFKLCNELRIIILFL